MKPSRYNFIINRNGKSYWCNGVTHARFQLSESLGSKIQLALVSPTALKNASETLYDKLVAGGFLISKDIDEVKEVFNLNSRTVNDKTIHLTILPTLNCNYKCWYCIQEHVAGSKMSAETMEKVKRFIKNKAEDPEVEAINIEWFGGEPFMYFDVVEEICRYADNVCKQNDVILTNSATTNAYFLTKERIGLLKKYNFRHFQVTLDGTRESHDKVKYLKGLPSAFDHALTNINNMLEAMPQLSILLRINYTRENIDTRMVEQVCGFIRPDHRNRVKVLPRKVWQVKTDDAYQETTTEIWSNFKKQGFMVQNSGIIKDFVPCYTCRRNFLTINHNGHLLKCTANNDLYTSEPKGVLTYDGTLEWSSEYLKQFEAKSFDNEKCLACKYLPLCMGMCPKDYNPQQSRCKKDHLDLSFEDSIVNEIELSL